jgi:uncharacterized protein
MDADQLEALARRRGIRLLLQYGSSVTGRLHAGSDLDLGVLLERVPESLHELGDLADDLQALAPGREADVAVLNHADPLFLKRVTEEAVVVYGSRRLFQELKMYAFKRYQDHRRFFEMERAYVRRRLHAAGP